MRGVLLLNLVKAALIKVCKPVIMHIYVLHGPNALIYCEQIYKGA